MIDVILYDDLLKNLEEILKRAEQSGAAEMTCNNAFERLRSSVNPVAQRVPISHCGIGLYRWCGSRSMPRYSSMKYTKEALAEPSTESSLASTWRAP